MKVVFYSNILISGLLFPGRQAERAVLRVIEGRDRLLISKEIIKEVLDVLARKFAREREELARTAVLLAELGEIVQAERQLSVLRDQADNRILECAVAGHAALIVTGDREMLRLRTFQGIAIVSLRDFLES
ncbi:MAG: putative toxin-antitoxin system toxin component, PIN family [Candidatus Binataceae bacterium]